ncbi:FAD-binding protein [Neobacillus drentensis]|uniref:FAD-binding protein n=1 Tax=Neobacillus drentensis TaxID=220684 RepID=UPI0023D93A59|nr:FAD-binding protein [Neobacillus drentensis]
MVNAKGERFVDEGSDFRNYTYANIGKQILEQPGQFAWQIFDNKVSHLLREEYKHRQVTKVTANSIEELAKKLDDIDPDGLLQTIKQYNASIRNNIPFNPNIKDGRCTKGLSINKSNWANTLDQAPFEAYAVTCGITFTYGGLRINSDSEVQDTLLQSISGLYAAGELVGGLFYFNYPGGAGLMAGSVFGKIAGEKAAQFASYRGNNQYEKNQI